MPHGSVAVDCLGISAKARGLELHKFREAASKPPMSTIGATAAAMRGPIAELAPPDCRSGGRRRAGAAALFALDVEVDQLGVFRVGVLDRIGVRESQIDIVRIGEDRVYGSAAVGIPRS